MEARREGAFADSAEARREGGFEIFEIPTETRREGWCWVVDSLDRRREG